MQLKKNWSLRVSQFNNPSKSCFNDIESIPVGFQNLGNTCYISSVLQLLAHLISFREVVNNSTIEEFIKTYSIVEVEENDDNEKYTESDHNQTANFLKSPELKNTTSISNQKNLKITNTIKAILDNLVSSKTEILSTQINNIRKNLSKPDFDNSEQHCAMEFLTKLIYSIHLE